MSSFCITLSHRALQLAYIEKGSPSSSWRWWQRCVIVGLLILVISVGLLMTGWGMTWVGLGRGRSCPLLKPVWKPVLNCQNLATWFFLYSDLMDHFEGSWRFDDHQWNSRAACEKFMHDYVKNHAWTLQVTLPAQRGSWHLLIIRPMYPMTDDSWYGRMYFNLETTEI